MPNRLEREAAMKTLKHAYLGEQTCIILTRYDESSDDYEGIAIKKGNLKVQVIGGTEGESVSGFGKKVALIPNMEFVTGLKAYPDPNRPNYPKQFVEYGADLQPLIDIGQKAADAGKDTLDQGGIVVDEPGSGAPVVTEPHPGKTGGGVEFDHQAAADRDHSGGVSKKEARKYEERTGEKVEVTE